MQTQVHTPLPSSSSQERWRTIAIGEHEVRDDRLLFNGGPNDYRDKLYAIHAPFGNFSRCLGILWSAGEHEVLDDACDAGLLDSLQIPENEATEDSTRLGNASEPFDLDNVSIVQIPASTWQADWEFVFALGRCAGGEKIETGADL